nr:MAG TPA_asm: hypothetical protein [Caudoviricetes sp.]
MAAAAWSPTWQVDLLDDGDNLIARLDGVTAGRVLQTQGTSVGEAGELTFDQRLPEELDWHHHRVRLTRNPGVAGVEPWPVATLLFQQPRRAQQDGWSTRHVQLVGKLSRLEQWQIGEVLVVPQGTDPVAWAAAVVEEKLGGLVSATPTEQRLSADQSFEPGDSWLKVINELLGAANYRSLFCDGLGVPQLAPYELPAARSVTATLTDEDGTALHQPEWDYAPDLEVPNHVVLEQQGSGEEPGLVVEAWNDDPDDPYSIVNSPVRSHYESAEFTDLATGQELARRKLVDLHNINNDLDIECATLPLRPGDRFHFHDQGNSYDVTVWEVEHQVEDLADMRVKGKEVVS